MTDPPPAPRSPAPLLVALGLAALLLAGLALWPPGDSEDGRRVVLYTAHNQAIIDLLVQRFEAETGIRTEVVKLGSGEVIQRIRAERERPRCDVIWSIAGDQLQAHPELLQAYEPREAAAIDPAFRVGDRWLPYTAIVVALCLNTEQVPEAEAPTRWSDLAAPTWKGRIASARADRSGSSYMQLMTVLAAYPQRGWEVYAGILANLQLSPSSSAVPRLVNDGEAALGITLEDNAQRYVAGGGPLRIVYPAEGTSAAPDGIALVAGAPHPVEAQAFIDWALSKPVQDLLVQQLGRRSVRRDGASPPGLPALSELKTLPYDFQRAAATQEAAVTRWTQLVNERGS